MKLRQSILPELYRPVVERLLRTHAAERHGRVLEPGMPVAVLGLDTVFLWVQSYDEFEGPTGVPRAELAVALQDIGAMVGAGGRLAYVHTTALPREAGAEAVDRTGLQMVEHGVVLTLREAFGGLRTSTNWDDAGTQDILVDLLLHQLFDGQCDDGDVAAVVARVAELFAAFTSEPGQA